MSENPLRPYLARHSVVRTSHDIISSGRNVRSRERSKAFDSNLNLNTIHSVGLKYDRRLNNTKFTFAHVHEDTVNCKVEKRAKNDRIKIAPHTLCYMHQR